MKVAIHPIVLHKLRTWQTYAGKNEIAVIGHIVPVNTDTIYLLDVYMAEQEGASASNSMDTAAVSSLLMQLFEEKNLQPGDLRCHIHTHPSFSTSPSHVDDDTSFINFNKYDYMLTGIFDGKEKFSFHLNLFKPFNIRMEIESFIDYSILFEGNFKAEFDANFKEKKLVTPTYKYSKNYAEYGVQTHLLGSNINVNRKVEEANVDDSVLVEITNLIKDYFEGKVVKARNYNIHSDRWKYIQPSNNPDVVRTYYDDHGFTKDDLKSYIVKCLDDKITTHQLQVLIAEDVRYKRLDDELLLSEMTSLEINHLANMLERGDPWMTTLDFHALGD